MLARIAMNLGTHQGPTPWKACSRNCLAAGCLSICSVQFRKNFWGL